MLLPELQINDIFNGFEAFGTGKKTGGKTMDPFSGIMKNILNRVNAGKGLSQGKALEASIREKQPKLLEVLKKYLLSKGISLDQVYADDAALDHLKTFLRSGGFNGETVERLLGGLKNGSFKKGVRLSDLFSRLSELEGKREPDTVLDISAVPYIESILSKLLPEPEYRNAALKDVKIEGQGVSLTRLVENLKQILNRHPEKGRFMPNETDQRQLSGLLDRFGIESDKGTGKLTLGRFVSELENLTVRMDRQTSHQRMETAELKGFFDGLKPVDDSHAGVKQAKNLNPEEISQKAFNPEQSGKHSKMDLKSDGQTAERHSFRQEGQGPKTAETTFELKSSVATAESSAESPKFAERMVMPEPKPTVRTLPTYVLNQVSRQILRSHPNNMNDITLQLKPPHLGRLQMHIDHSGEMIRVSIVTEQQAAREILMSHAGELRTTLSEQGMRVEKIDIQFDQNFEQSMANARHESNRSNERRQRGSRSTQSPEQTETVSEETSEPIRGRRGVLDLVA